MDIVGLGLGIVGLLAILVSSIWLIVCAFQKSVVWGLMYMFVPFASIVYLFLDWNKAWKPFVITIAGMVVSIAGIMISPSMQKGMADASTHSSAPLAP